MPKQKWREVPKESSARTFIPTVPLIYPVSPPPAPTFACSHVRMFACSHVRMFACSVQTVQLPCPASPMPKTTKVVTQLPVRLDKELQAFEDEAYPLLPSQRKRFEQLASLIGQTVTRTATNSSRASQWRLTRASRMLHAIGSNLGAEVLYLCTQVSTVNSLCSMDESDVISILSTWWSNKPCPASLTRAAEQLWKSCALDDHIQTQSPRVRADIAVHNPPEAAQVDAESQSLDNHIRTQSPRTRGEIAEPNLPEAAQVDTEGQSLLILRPIYLLYWEYRIPNKKEQTLTVMQELRCLLKSPQINMHLTR